MSNLYVAEATVTARLGERSTDLLDRDGDGSADTGLLAAVIESVGRRINMHLAQRYDVPFAEITDSPATPEEIQEIALNLVLWELYRWRNPEGPDTQAHLDMALSDLQQLRNGDFDLGSGSRVDAVSGKHIVSATYADPVISGQDSNSVDRLRGV